MAVDKILVVESEPFIRKSIEECLRLRRYAVHGAGTLAEAERFLHREAFDLVLLEITLPDGEGLDLLEQLLGRAKRPLVVMMSAPQNMDAVTQCVRRGAFDYLVKPFGLNQVELIVRKAEAYQQVVKVNQHLSAAAEVPAFLGASPAMQRLQAQLRKIAPTDATVLIEGEPGCGKTFFARQLHRESARSSAPYLELNCQLQPEELLAARLFGQEKGALASSPERREGRLELADGGTLLLESVDALPLALQEKVLRFLLTREFERLGSARSQKADVRLLATVRGSLLARVEAGDFQENFFYRLNVLPIRIPALRERGEDLPRLAEYFRQYFAQKYGKDSALSEEALATLSAQPWPANVRELELALERAVLAVDAPNPITPAHLALAGASAPIESGPFEPMHELERQHIFRAIDRARGNRTKAADLLGISVRTLRNKLHEYRAAAVSAGAALPLVAASS